MTKGRVAGRMIRKKISISLAPRTRAALIRVLSMLRMPWKIVMDMVMNVQIQIRMIWGGLPTPAAITISGA